MKLDFDVEDGDFVSAGEASSKVKKVLKHLSIPTPIIKKIAVAMYEAEINMVIHANGGKIFVETDPDKITIVLADKGPGIPDLEKAMQEGYSTASEEARALGFGAGMGLSNMKKCTDEMKVESVLGVGTTVTLIVNL